MNEVIQESEHRQLIPDPVSVSVQRQDFPLIDSTHSPGIEHSPSSIRHLLNSIILIVLFKTVSSSSVSLSNDPSMELEFRIKREKSK